MEYIREAKESGNPLYERLKEGYLAPHEGNYEFKLASDGDTLKLYHNNAPVGVEWLEITVDDFIMR